MKHHLRTLFFVCILLGALLLAGCAQQGQVYRQESDAPENSLSAESQQASAVTTGGAAMTFIDTENANLAAGSADGYYQIVSTAGGYLLCYTDYATATRIVLCPDPACTHQDDSCPAWLLRPGIPFVHGDKLYVFRDSTFSPDVPENEAAQQLLCMGLDGSDRRVVARFSLHQELIGSMAADDTCLYAVQFSADLAEDVTTTQQLVKISLADGAVQPLQEIDTYGFIMGGCGDRLYYKTIDYRLPEPGQDPEEVAANQQHVLYCLDTASGTSTEVLRWRQDELQLLPDARQPNTAYTLRPGEGCCELEKIDLITGASLWQQQIPTPRPDAAAMTWLGGPYLRVTTYEEADNEDGYNSFYYAVDSRSAEVRELLLRYSAGGTPAPYSVLAATEDRFFVIHDTETKDYSLIDKDGNRREGFTTVFVYGLIDQQDFVNNQDNVTRIEDQVPSNI